MLIFVGDFLASPLDRESVALCFASNTKLLQLAGYDGPPIVQSTVYEEPLLASRAAVVSLYPSLIQASPYIHHAFCSKDTS